MRGYTRAWLFSFRKKFSRGIEGDWRKRGWKEGMDGRKKKREKAIEGFELFIMNNRVKRSGKIWSGELRIETVTFKEGRNYDLECWLIWRKKRGKGITRMKFVFIKETSPRRDVYKKKMQTFPHSISNDFLIFPLTFYRSNSKLTSSSLTRQTPASITIACSFLPLPPFLSLRF